MKHQYFGDIGDYKKFSILRYLTNESGLTIIVCWMLTPNDTGTDGRFVEYLKNAGNWRRYDKEVFDLLQKSVLYENTRNLAVIEKSKLISNVEYISNILEDPIDKRKSYFENLFVHSKKFDIIFFDPDNGIEVESVSLGKKKSSKYIYWQEIHEAFSKGYSLLIYQHFNRSNRHEFMEKIAKNLKAKLSVENIFLMKSQNAFFALIPQKKHIFQVEASLKRISSNWDPHISVYIFDQRGFRNLYSKERMDLFNQNDF